MILDLDDVEINIEIPTYERYERPRKIARDLEFEGQPSMFRIHHFISVILDLSNVEIDTTEIFLMI